MQQKITLPTAIQFNASATDVTVKNVSVNPAGTGTWTIQAELEVVTPERAEVAGIRLMERHMVNMRVEVTRAELAAAVNLPVEDVQTISVAVLEATVTQLAMGKLLAAFA